MTQRAFSDFRILIVPGLHNSGPDHWQTRWQQLHPSFERVVQEQWDVPDLPVWSKQLERVLCKPSLPTLIVAHSFGCLAAVHRVGSDVSNLAGALLVAPAEPEKFDVSEALHHISLPCPAIVVGSLNDPWMERSRAAYWAERWGCDFVNAGELGHINADSRLGDWSFGLSLLRRLIGTVSRGPVARRVPGLAV